MRSGLREPTGLSWNPPPGRTTATRPTRPHYPQRRFHALSRGTATARPSRRPAPAASAMQRRTGQPEPGAPWRPRHRGRHRRQRHRLRPPAVHDSIIATDFQRATSSAGAVCHPRRTLSERVFASYGTLVWLSDPQALGRRHRPKVLVPGGRFVLVEFHPFALCFDPHWQPAYDYFSREPIAESGVSAMSPSPAPAWRPPATARRRRELQPPSSQLRVPVGLAV